MDEWDALVISLRSAKSTPTPRGMVPDEKTAATIGEAIAIAQFGEAPMAKQRPFKAKLYGNAWLVKGTLYPAGAYGGTAVVKIDKHNGKVLLVLHQQ